MSFLGIMEIGKDPGSDTVWSFDHAQHHSLITQTINTPVAFTGDTLIGSPVITNLSTTRGLFPGMAIAGVGIPGTATIVAIDQGLLALSINVLSTVTNVATALTAAFALIPFFILDPINQDDRRQFLLDHQNSHNFINSALGNAGNDLQDVDFHDQGQVNAWIDLNFTEHQQWSDLLLVS